MTSLLILTSLLLSLSNGVDYWIVSIRIDLVQTTSSKFVGWLTDRKSAVLKRCARNCLDNMLIDFLKAHVKYSLVSRGICQDFLPWWGMVL